MKMKLTFQASKSAFYFATVIIDVPDGTKPDDLNDELLTDLRENHIGDDDWEYNTDDWDDPEDAPPPDVDPIETDEKPDVRLIRDKHGDFVIGYEEQ